MQIVAVRRQIFTTKHSSPRSANNVTGVKYINLFHIGYLRASRLPRFGNFLIAKLFYSFS
jgi:hypothetical protein